MQKGTLYRIPKGDLNKDLYSLHPAFGFEFEGYLFFTTRAAAALFSTHIVEITPT